MQSVGTEFIDLTPIIPVGDMVKTIDFYERILGFQCLTPFRSGEHVLYAFLKRDGILLHLHHFEEEELKTRGKLELRLQVRNIQPFFDELKIKGALEPKVTITETSWDTREFLVVDCNGVKLHIFEDIDLF